MFRLFTAFIITLLAMPVLAQRANFDSERMDRDLRIMERIYTDLQRQAAGVMGTINTRVVHGSYFSGYGIMFNVNETFSSNFLFGTATQNPNTNLTSVFVKGFGTTNRYSGVISDSMRSKVNDATTALTSKIKETNETREVPVDSLSIIAYERNKDVIRDFFANYIDAIGQLDDNDKVSVVISNRGNPIVYTTVSTNSRLQTSSFNPLRAEVQIKDVVAYRTGSINESTFLDRIVFSELDSQASNQKELQVMQGIFESALRENKSTRFALSRNVNGVILTNFGAMFNLDIFVNTNSSVFGFPSNNIKAVEVIKSGDNSGFIELLLMDSTKVIIPNSQSFNVTGSVTEKPVDQIIVSGNNSMVNGLKVARVEGVYISLAEALDKFIDETSELILDYGRTLRSLKSDELILISINQLTSQTNPDLPKRVEIQIDMQTLRDLDRGSISRDQAKQKLIVRKFNS